MAHEFESGFLVKEAAWHKLGTVIEEAPSIEEVVELNGEPHSITLEEWNEKYGRDE